MIQWFKRIFSSSEPHAAQKDAPPQAAATAPATSTAPQATALTPQIAPARLAAKQPERSRPKFRSAALAALYDEIAEISHPEHPFLDKSYSPGSYMPAADFSPWIASMRSRQDNGAIDELLGYLAYQTQGQAVRKTMSAIDLKRLVRGDDEFLNELWAVLFLGYRYIETGHESNRISLLRETISQSLASWRFELVAESIPHLIEGANKFIRKRNRENSASPDPLLDSGYLTSLAVPEVSSVGELVRRFPVTFRACVSYSIQRGSPVVGCIRPQLGGHYGLRQFGLSAEFNRTHFATAEFFRPPEDVRALAERMKKDELQGIAAAASLPVKKSAKKEELVALLLSDEKAKELVGAKGAVRWTPIVGQRIG